MNPMHPRLAVQTDVSAMQGRHTPHVVFRLFVTSIIPRAMSKTLVAEKVGAKFVQREREEKRNVHALTQ